MLVIPLGWQPVDANGNPYAGALAYLYRTGTSTPQAGYSDSTLATPLSNPVVADSAGRFPAVYAGMVYDYKVILKTSAGATLETYDPIGATFPGLSLSGHTGEVFATFDDTSNKFDLDVRNIAMSGDLTLTGASIVEAMGAAVAGATTTNIWAGDGGTVHITGSGATITSLGTAPQAGARMLVIMDGAHTLTHGANLDLPGNVNRTTAAGDRFEVLAETTSALRVVHYTADSGAAGIVMVGDSGSGGTAGLAPAPAAGDADKYLSGAATYVRPARVLLATKTPSGASSITFVAADGFNATKYCAYEIEFTALPSVDGADLNCLFTTDDGATWKTGATDYHWLSQYILGTGSLVGSANEPAIQVVGDIGNAAGRQASGTIKIMSRGTGVRATELMSRVTRKNAAGITVIEETTGYYGAATAINGFWFGPSSGNMTGEFQIYGITK